MAFHILCSFKHSHIPNVYIDNKLRKERSFSQISFDYPYSLQSVFYIYSWKCYLNLKRISIVRKLFLMDAAFETSDNKKKKKKYVLKRCFRFFKLKSYLDIKIFF